MKRRIIVLILALICLFSFLAVSVCAEVSTPSGYDVSLTLRTFTFDGGGVFTFSNTVLPSPNISDVTVTGGPKLKDYLSTVYDGFSFLGYMNSSDYKQSADCVLFFNFSSGYSTYYIVVPYYSIRVPSSYNGGVTLYTLFPTISNATYISGSETRLNWQLVYDAGPYVALNYMLYTVTDTSFHYRLSYVYNPSVINPSSDLNLSFPIFSPMAFTTAAAASSFVRDTLSDISSSLDDVNSKLDDFLQGQTGTNSRLDELEQGLFSAPSGWDDYNESVQAVISDQAVLEDSLDYAANSVFGEGLADYSLDTSGVQSSINDVLGDDPGGSSFIRFFQWIWTINPLLVVEVGLVFLFFVVFLLIRVYP